MHKRELNIIRTQNVEGCRIITDLLNTDGDAVEAWRIFRIMSEFVEGFELLRKYGLAVTFYGSSRFMPGDLWYKEAEKLSTKLAKKKFAVITGGGPGIMEAGNVGAFKVGGQSVGLNINLPTEQKPNPYTTASQDFSFFFSRKVMLAFASEVYIYFPGGYGTLDEFFEMITLVQTKKIKPIPILLVDKKFWEPLIDYLKTTLVKEFKTINKNELDLFHLVDNADEAYKWIMKNVDTST